MDVRVGGGCRLVFAGDSVPISFFGTHFDVPPHSRLRWRNDESPDGPVTTGTLSEEDGRTR
jgi:hypothetical protein